GVSGIWAAAGLKCGWGTPRKLRQLRADSRRAGWRKSRQRGRHETWDHPLLPGAVVRLAGYGARSAGSERYTRMDNRRAISRAYKERKLLGGVYRFTNTQNGKYLLGHAANLASVRNHFQFAVTTGSAVHPKLRGDWSAFGP